MSTASVILPFIYANHAMCFEFAVFQKQLQVDPLRQFQPRILNIQMNRDLPSTYNSIMNSLFRYD